MRPAYAASFVAALACHALLLFGFKLGTSASPLALSDDPSPIDVSLVAAAPEPQPAEPAPPPPVPAPTPEPTPPPPVPEPTPDMSTPPPEPLPTPAEETEPSPEPPRETPPPRPRQPRHSQKTGHAAAPMIIHGEIRQGAAPSGPIGTAVRYRSNPKPDYPEEARRQHQEGVVVLSVEVSTEGRPTDISLKRSSGYDMLDQAAIQAVRRWTFDPARVASFPVESRVDVPIRFSLSD